MKLNKHCIKLTNCLTKERIQTKHKAPTQLAECLIRQFLDDWHRVYIIRRQVNYRRPKAFAFLSNLPIFIGQVPKRSDLSTHKARQPTGLFPCRLGVRRWIVRIRSSTFRSPVVGGMGAAFACQKQARYVRSDADYTNCGRLCSVDS